MIPEREKISNFQDEADHFHKIIERKSQEAGFSFERLPEKHKEQIIQDAIEEHKQTVPKNLSQEYVEQKEEAQHVVLNLDPDDDDKRMETLLALMHKVGIYNTLDAVQKTEDYHINDDFHRFLVQYIKAGNLIDLKEKSPLYPGLHMTLFEVSLPELTPEKKNGEQEKTLEMLLSSMEQFYAGMVSVAEESKNKYFSIELAMPPGKTKVAIYLVIPDEQKNIFRNHLLAVFPDAVIVEIYNDYNVFKHNNEASMTVAEFSTFMQFPLKIYKQMQYDPLNIVLKSFSSLSFDEGGAVQLILSPESNDANIGMSEAVDKIVSEGRAVEDTIGDKPTYLARFFDWLLDSFIAGFDALTEAIFGIKKGEGEKKVLDQEKRNEAVQMIKEKNTSRLFKTNFRIVSSAETKNRAEAIIQEIASGFMQFENPTGNKIVFKKVEEKTLKEEIRKYIYRVFDKEKTLFLNFSELTSIFHFPVEKLKAGSDILDSSSSAFGVSSSIVEQSAKIQSSLKTDVSKLKQKTTFKLRDKQKEVPKKNLIVEENKNSISKDLLENTQNTVLNQNVVNVGNDSDMVQNTPNPDFHKYGQYFEHSEIIVPGTSGVKKEKVKKNTQVQNNFIDQAPKNKIEREEYSDFDLSRNNFNTKPLVESENKETEEKNTGKKNNNGSPVLLGVNFYQGTETPVYLQPQDRLRHMYVIGQTGTGKTTILKNMVVQDIKNGEGVCFIDPHGSDIEDILSLIPEDRYEDVIYFDPASLEKPLGLNMLEHDSRFPEQKTFVINELFSIFQKLYNKIPESMGPMFEQYFRNATALVMEDPESGNTMVEISRVLSDKEFRDYKLSKCNNMLVKQFWEKIASQAGGEASLENMVPYITNKFDVFLSNDFLRPIIAQEKSSFDFRKIMDTKKILLVNLSKGRLGEINSNLIGMIIVGKIQMAAMSRVTALDEKLPPFYLYIDEFQNVTTDSISSILSEARKYNLSLTIAHQYIKQIDEKIKDAVFGNVGSMAIFRVGFEDVEVLEKQLAPVFSAKDILNLKNYNAYLKIMVNGEPQKPFNIKTIPPEDGNTEVREYLKHHSKEKYGRPRDEIEKEVQEKFRSINKIPETSTDDSDMDFAKMLEQMNFDD